MWLHVDAAWAGVALACPEFRQAAHLDHINRYADSFCTNFHKAIPNVFLKQNLILTPFTFQWGLLSFDASILWARNRKNLTDALDITPEFLRTKQGDAGETLFNFNLT